MIINAYIIHIADKTFLQNEWLNETRIYNWGIKVEQTGVELIKAKLFDFSISSISNFAEMLVISCEPH